VDGPAFILFGLEAFRPADSPLPGWLASSTPLPPEASQNEPARLRETQLHIQLPANDNIDNYIVVEMDDKGDRREIEMGSVGGTVGEKVGIRADRIVRTSATPVGGRHFKISPVKEMKKGEYILYSVGSADFPHGVYGQGYDFTVQ
jgi:hypothetical protein